MSKWIIETRELEDISPFAALVGLGIIILILSAIFGG